MPSLSTYSTNRRAADQEAEDVGGQRHAGGYPPLEDERLEDWTYECLITDI
jgi:hypothetical protein